MAVASLEDDTCMGKSVSKNILVDCTDLAYKQFIGRVIIIPPSLFHPI